MSNLRSKSRSKHYAHLIGDLHHDLLYIPTYHMYIFIILYFRCQTYLATKTGILSAAHPILLNLRAPRQAYPHPTTPITPIRIIKTIRIIRTIKTIRTITNMSLLSTTIVILIQPANQWAVAIYWWIPGPIILEKTTIIVTNLIKKCHMNLFLWKLQLMSPLPNVLLKCTLLRLDLLLFIPFIFLAVLHFF